MGIGYLERLAWDPLHSTWERCFSLDQDSWLGMAQLSILTSFTNLHVETRDHRGPTKPASRIDNV